MPGHITGAEVGAVTDHDDGLDEAEVEYDMSAWTSSQCSAFTRRLDKAAIPWFWRKRILVVYSEHEATVNEMLE
jgi:hypothetical protein